MNLPNRRSSVKTFGKARSGSINSVDTASAPATERIGLLERANRRRAERNSTNARPVASHDTGDEACGSDNGGEPPASDTRNGGSDGRPTGGDHDATNSPPATQALFGDVVNNPETARPTNGRAKHDTFLTERYEPQFLCANPFLISKAGGKVPGLVLQGLMYWVADARDGFPRWRPQPHFDRPSCGPGYLNLANQIGLAVESRKSAEDKVARAIKKLVNESLIESFSLSDEPPDADADMDWSATLSDQRQKSRRWFRLTPEFAEEYEVAVSSQREKYGVVPSVKVWLADVRERDPSQAIVLGQLWYHCVAPGKNLCAYHQGMHWLPRSYKDLGRETGLTANQVRPAVVKLQSGGLISAETFRFKGQPMQHYLINETARTVIQRWRDDFSQQRFDNQA